MKAIALVLLFLLACHVPFALACRDVWTAWHEELPHETAIRTGITLYQAQDAWWEKRDATLNTACWRLLLPWAIFGAVGVWIALDSLWSEWRRYR